MNYTNMLEMKRNSLNEIKIDLLLISIFIFGLIDLFITYYVYITF